MLILNDGKQNQDWEDDVFAWRALLQVGQWTPDAQHGVFLPQRCGTAAARMDTVKIVDHPSPTA